MLVAQPIMPVAQPIMCTLRIKLNSVQQSLAIQSNHTISLGILYVDHLQNTRHSYSSIQAITSHGQMHETGFASQHSHSKLLALSLIDLCIYIYSCIYQRYSTNLLFVSAVIQASQRAECINQQFVRFKTFIHVNIFLFKKYKTNAIKYMGTSHIQKVQIHIQIL